MTELTIALSLFAGSLLILIAALGVLRMPDAYMRMSTSSKATTLGVALVLTASALQFGQESITGRAAAILAFIFMTTPIGAHRIARAAYIAGVPLWENTKVDQLRGRYDPGTHVLQGTEPEGHPPRENQSQ